MGYEYKLIDSYTDAQGLMPMLYSIRDAVPLAFPALLFGIFVLLSAGFYFLDKSKTGRAKILIGIVAASFANTVLASFLALALLIQFRIVVIWLFVFLISLIAMIISDRIS